MKDAPRKDAATATIALSRVVPSLRRASASWWAPPLLAFLLILEATALPQFSFPKTLTRSFSSVHYCYFPWQFSISRLNGTLVSTPNVPNPEFSATADVNLWQSSFWAQTSTEYRTVIGDWKADGSAVTASEHAEIKALVIAELEKVDTKHRSVYLDLLKNKGEGQFTVARPLGYLHNALALVLFGLFVYSCKANFSKLSRGARRQAAKSRNECFACGYSLIGCPEDRCPECGTDQAS